MSRKPFCLKMIFAKKQASAEVERLTMGRREALGQTTVGVQKKACQDGGAVVGIGSVFDRGTYAHGMVAALTALLLVLQGLLVSGGTMAYALDGDGGQTGGDAVRTEVRDCRG